MPNRVKFTSERGNDCSWNRPLRFEISNTCTISAWDQEKFKQHWGWAGKNVAYKKKSFTHFGYNLGRSFGSFLRRLHTWWRILPFKIYFSNCIKVHIDFRKFSTEWKIFRGPYAQYDFFCRKNRTAHTVRGKFSEVYMHLNIWHLRHPCQVSNDNRWAVPWETDALT